LNGERLLVLPFLNNWKNFITIATVIPVEYRVKYILPSHLDISCLFPIPLHIFRIIILNLFSLPV
jgi:hypothetical protein